MQSALETSEIVTVQNELVEAVSKAMMAGVDGVEIHGANGNLP